MNLHQIDQSPQKRSRVLLTPRIGARIVEDNISRKRVLDVIGL